jgi:hypothetical protein
MITGAGREDTEGAIFFGRPIYSGSGRRGRANIHAIKTESR